MATVKIGIVEDEMVIAASIVSILKKLNYDVIKPANGYTAALNMIENDAPDLSLLDINLGGQKDGVDVAEFVRENHHIPIIFLTANSDAATIQRVKKVKPNAYLIKPFTKDDLYAAIEIAIHSFYENNENAISKLNIIVKSGYDYVNMKFDEITFLESDDNYVSIHLRSGKPVMIRSTLTEIMNKLPASQFFKVSRSVIINLNFVSKIETDQIIVNTNSFSILPKIKKELVDRLS